MATVGLALKPKTSSDVPVEVSTLGRGGHQALVYCWRHTEIEVDHTASEFQSQQLSGAVVRDCRKGGRIDRVGKRQ